MDIIISFVDGPLDGATLTSESTDPVELSKVRWIAMVVSGCLKDAEKREVRFEPGFIYSVPSELIMAKAKSENWSEDKIAALMPRYDYEFLRVREADGIAEVTLQFRGMR